MCSNRMPRAPGLWVRTMVKVGDCTRPLTASPSAMPCVMVVLPAPSGPVRITTVPAASCSPTSRPMARMSSGVRACACSCASPRSIPLPALAFDHVFLAFHIHDDPLDAWPAWHRDDLVGDGVGGRGEVLHAGLPCCRVAEDDGPVARLHGLGGSALGWPQGDDELVHADPPDLLVAFAIDADLHLSGRRPWYPVRVACGDDGGARVLRGGPDAAVADGFALRDDAGGDDLRAHAHRPPQRQDVR